jgi:hypothetical protein
VTCCTDRNPVSWNQNLRQVMASEHMLQRFSVNPEGFGSPTEIVLVHVHRAHSTVSLEILQRHPAGYLRST